MPPGNGNFSGPTAKHIDDQRVLYDSLENPVAEGALTDADLDSHFKDAPLGSSPAVRSDHPADGVTIEWDAYGVPRVKGDTAEQVAWGAGWVVAESRLLIAEAGRLLGRAGTIEMGGGDIVGAIGQVGSLPQLNYTDAELEASIDDAVAAAGDEGPKLLSALDSFVDGLNHWLDTNTFPQELRDLGLQWRHWNRADVMAVGTIVDDIFGTGGGDEVGNANLLSALEAQLGERSARAVFDELRLADDPMSTAHTAASFPYPLFERPDGGRSSEISVEPAAVARPDTALRTPEVRDPTASNYVAVTGERTRSGHPVLVGGPQSSYFAPQLLLEMELQGGGYDARGITFPGLGPWVVIGRGRDFAWTATAGGSDVVDQRVEKLCEPDGTAPTVRSRHYEFKGSCVAMTRPDTQPMTAWRTVHGPVVGQGTVDGAPVAISRERMSRFRTSHAARAFWALNRGHVRSAADFAPTMASIPMSFNWVYVDATDVAYFHSGWFPVRAAGVDPDLPSWGTGEWEWQGRLDWSQQPQEIAPAGGVAISWNNRIAPGWREPDTDWAAGDIQRVDLLGDRLDGRSNMSVADVVTVAQDAATVDLRGERVLPELLKVLGDTGAPSPRAETALRQLRAWSDAGSHRRDLDGDQWYDDPAVAIMDLWFPAVVESVFAPVLGSRATSKELRRPKAFDNAPSLTGGAYASGWYNQLVRDLERARGVRDVPTDVPVACGGGSLDACRALLWSTLDRAAADSFGLAKPAALERIRFIPFVFNLESTRWMNRPTFQQVVSFG